MSIPGEFHPEIGSTQTRLKEVLQKDPLLPHGYAVWAEVQTAGRGRGDHGWVSVKGNLHASILLRKVPFAEMTWVPLWVSLCILKALKDFGVDSSRLQVKWPNDLWIESTKKVAGILCEKKGDAFIVGIGLNLLRAAEAEQSTGAIADIFVQPIQPAELLERLLVHFSGDIHLNQLKSTYEAHALFKAGDSVQWKNDVTGEGKSGTVRGLGEYGELLVDVDGKIIPLFAEDVRMMRKSEVS